MTNFMNFWCVRGGGEEGCLGQGPVWAMSSPCRGLRVRWAQGRGQRKEASLRGQGREPGCVGRWKPWGAEAEHVSKPGAFPVCRQAQGQCFHELEIGTSGGWSAWPFFSVGLQCEVKELVLSGIPGACLCAVFSFMLPLVVFGGTQSTEATLQLHLRHISAKGHCSGCSHFGRPCG